MLAIAAMSRNRVIGSGSRIPWRIPAELKWFRRMTLGGVVVMGRKTFASLPKPLDGRVTVVLTHDPRRLLEDEAFRERYGEAVLRPSAQGSDIAELHLPKLPLAQVRVARGIESLAEPGVKTWLCGGAQVYEQFLRHCTELYLSVIDRDVEGDAYFPPFEQLFEPAGVVEECPEFRVHHYVRSADR